MDTNEIWTTEHKKDVFGDPLDDLYIINKERFQGTFEDEDGRSGKIDSEILFDESGVQFVIYSDGSKKIMKRADAYSVSVKDSSGKRHDFQAKTDWNNKRISLEQEYVRDAVDILSAGQGAAAFYLTSPDEDVSFLFRAPCSNFQEVYQKLIEEMYCRIKHLVNEGKYSEAVMLLHRIGDYKDCLDMLKEVELVVAAQNGDADAAFQIGELGQQASFVDCQDREKWYKESAELGNAKAAYRLAKLYSADNDIIENNDLAFSWFEKAAALGDPDAKDFLGRKYFYDALNIAEKNSYKAIELFEKSAEYGYEDALLLLDSEHGDEDAWYVLIKTKPNCYLLDEDSYEDEENLRWQTRTAKLGIVKAAAELGDGEIISRIGDKYYCAAKRVKRKNAAKAFSWIEKAAEYGNEDAAYELSKEYKRGKFLPKDETEALKWRIRAAELGCLEAKNGLQNELSKRTVKAVKESNYEEAVKWLKSIDASGKSRLADCFMDKAEKIKRTDSTESEKWYVAAAELGNAIAAIKLAEMYESGDGVETDISKANEWSEKADGVANVERLCRNESDYDAMLRWLEKKRSIASKDKAKSAILRYCCEEKYFYAAMLTERNNINKSIEWYKKAADLGSARAAYELGIIYEYDERVRNCETAKEWYKKAEDLGNDDTPWLLGAMFYCYYEEYDHVQTGGMAFRCFKKAFETEYSEEINELEMQCKDEKMKDEVIIEKWYKKALELASANTACRIGDLYIEEFDDSSEEAIKWYLKAAELGNEDAIGSIGELYEDESDAIYSIDIDLRPIIEKAALQGNAGLAYKLGMYYWDGYDWLGNFADIDRNVDKAIEWFNEAVELGNTTVARKIVDEFGVSFYDNVPGDVSKYSYRVIKLLNRVKKLYAYENSDLLGGLYYCAYLEELSGELDDYSGTLTDLLRLGAEYGDTDAANALADESEEDDDMETVIDTYKNSITCLKTGGSKNIEIAEKCFEAAERCQYMFTENTEDAVIMWLSDALMYWEKATEDDISFKEKADTAKMLRCDFDDVDKEKAFAIYKKKLPGKYFNVAETFYNDKHDFGYNDIAISYYRKAAEMGETRATERLKMIEKRN